ncbi:uncharacterized protein B0H18DRAFT_43951 [Fomitopsis serialis]|uniref:uncharacterized protein n=1 Tax=Fomitopsis serialis TaxID=139415 RepID=UPI0020086FC2|nr:uncharacterized protein B0H18DRAFT_43951 [Neoantrodia serialis]KAH9917055.1 hypothetical protein B0H18DRAFT_43951 [Neoantrodia serialis]
MRKASAVALSLDEILRLIFEHVYAVGDSTAKPAQGVDKPIVIARQTLARCARVSQTFCSAALAVLWRNLDDLVPLFRLLGLSPVTPGYAYVIHKREERELVNVVDVSGHLERQQWARFQHFARLIRRVALVRIHGDTDLTTKQHIDSLDDSRLIVELAPSALLSAWRHNNEASLLPNLNVITFVVHDYISFSEPIHTIISPNVPLRSLRVQYDRIHTYFPLERNFISPILRVLDEVPVTVQHLRLHGVLNAQVMRSLTRLRNLQRSELLWKDLGVLQRWQSDTGYDESLSILSALSDLTELNLAFIEAGASQQPVNMAAVPSSGFLRCKNSDSQAILGPFRVPSRPSTLVRSPRLTSNSFPMLPHLTLYVHWSRRLHASHLLRYCVRCAFPCSLSYGRGIHHSRLSCNPSNLFEPSWLRNGWPHHHRDATH